jgi:[ribosomal protein S5]-alanine N-acetyltransferase
MKMPPLETSRLIIRPFVLDDLHAIHQILDIELEPEYSPTSPDERAQWLQWSILNYEALAKLYQPPYGDRAVVLKSTGQLIGACGFVPCLMPFEQLPAFSQPTSCPGLSSTEFGLYYAISPAHQRQGYASEAATALIEYAFISELRLKRVVATTTYDNVASMGVMRKLGMTIEKNPRPDPPWLQVVGVVENKQ